MNWPTGVQWEWALGDFLVLGLLFWELKRLRRDKAATRARLEQERLAREAGERRDAA